jgi:hypothetical protein
MDRANTIVEKIVIEATKKKVYFIISNNVSLVDELEMYKEDITK